MPRSSENRRHYHVDAVEDLIRAAVMVSYPTFTRARPAWQLVAAEQREHPGRFHRVRACYDTTCSHHFAGGRRLRVMAR